MSSYINMSIFQEKELDTGKTASKRRRRREKVQEDPGSTKLQVKILFRLHGDPWTVDILRHMRSAPPSTLHSISVLQCPTLRSKPRFSSYLIDRLYL